MDIRGVGGGGTGAVGIEYLERGSHLERNVFLHELIHLAHDDLFTEAQRRRVRALYREAIRTDRLLDYYSGTSEQEFLAQAVEAYFSSSRVHPLDHKSMNTRADLQRVDPELYAFVAELAGEMEMALAGDPEALRPMRAHAVRARSRTRPGSAIGGDWMPRRRGCSARRRRIPATPPSWRRARISWRRILRISRG